MRTLRRGRMLDGELILFFGGFPPEAGYAVDMDDHGYLYRNGQHQGYVRRMGYDRAALGWWVEYDAFTDTRLGEMTDLAGVLREEDE